MKQIFCTLFNHKYFSRGLALYNSLTKLKVNFHLYIFAFDTETEEYLKQLRLENITVIGLADFEDEELLRIKPTRTIQEYCWTCASSTIYYCINNFPIEHCTYLDADIYFFSDPIILYNEIGKNSVMITKHNYALDYDQTETSGKYCVQYICFKNDEIGNAILKDWRNACLEWCYARFENGKFGDQKYLDEWTTRYSGVHVIENHGAGLAPWNVSNYDISVLDSQIKIRDIKFGNIYNLVFYHFHDFKLSDDGEWHFVSGILGYKVWKDTLNLIYGNYLKELYYISTIHSSKINSDYPSLPKKILKTIFEGELIPAINDLNLKLSFRNSYSQDENSNYVLNKIDEKLKSNLFNSLIDIGYRLNRFTDAFFNLSKEFHIHSSSDIDYIKADNDLKKNLLEQKKAYSLIIIGEVKHFRIVSIENVEFSLTFDIPVSLPVTSFKWQPLNAFLCAVQLTSVQITTNSNLTLVIPNLNISNTGILDEEGWDKFLNLNHFYEINLSEPVQIVSIKFEGKINKIDFSHQLNNYQVEIAMLSDKLRILENSIFFKIRKIIIKPILRIAKMFTKK